MHLHCKNIEEGLVGVLVGQGQQLPTSLMLGSFWDMFSGGNYKKTYNLVCPSVTAPKQREWYG
jgi:hypothetical protein